MVRRAVSVLIIRKIKKRSFNRGSSYREKETKGRGVLVIADPCWRGTIWGAASHSKLKKGDQGTIRRKVPEHMVIGRKRHRSLRPSKGGVAYWQVNLVIQVSNCTLETKREGRRWKGLWGLFDQKEGRKLARSKSMQWSA